MIEWGNTERGGFLHDYSNAKKRWDQENTTIFSVKFFNTSEKDLITFMDSKVDKHNKIGRGTVLKQALRMYMASEIEKGNYKQEE